MRKIWVEITGRHGKSELGTKLTIEEWDDKFKEFFKNISKLYKNFELEHFYHIHKENKIETRVMFYANTEDEWDLSDSIDVTEYYNDEMFGNPECICDLLGNGAGDSSFGFDTIPMSKSPYHEHYVEHKNVGFKICGLKS